MQEIRSSDPERVCPPMCNVAVIWREGVYRDGNSLELLGVFGSHDIRETAWVRRAGPDCKRVEWWEPKAESLLEYA